MHTPLAHFTLVELPGTLGIFLLGALVAIALGLRNPDSFGPRLTEAWYVLMGTAGILLTLVVMGDYAGFGERVRLSADLALLAITFLLIRVALIPPGPDRLSRIVRRDGEILRASSDGERMTAAHASGMHARFPGL